MAKVKFTVRRISALKCGESKAQIFLWCAVALLVCVNG